MISGLLDYLFYLSGISRESFRVIVNAQELGFESTETPRTDRSVSFSPLAPGSIHNVC